MPELQINRSYLGHSFIDATFGVMSCNLEFNHAVSDHWPSSASPSLPANWECLASMRESDNERVWLVKISPDAIGLLGTSAGYVNVSVAGSSVDAATLALKAVRKLFPRSKSPSEGTIQMTFWWNTRRSPVSWHRVIAAPSWDQIKDNYPGAGELEKLSKLRTSPEGKGRLLLWHGLPGTGKTYAIRALAREWREWCDFQYVTDPEAFFGDASYMMEVLMQGAAEAPVGPSARPLEDSKWRMLIIEDANELIEPDAKQRTGQALGRLLNVAEGLIGQGLKVLLLITTNEKVGDLHPAVARPGRCFSNIEFKAFSKDEARRWLTTHNRDPEDAGERQTLADLYADRKPVRRSVGFAR